MPYNHHMTLCDPNKDALWHSQWLWKPSKCLCSTFPMACCDLHNYLCLHNDFVCLSQWFWRHKNDLCALMFVCDSRWLHVPSSQWLCVTLTMSLCTLKTTSVPLWLNNDCVWLSQWQYVLSQWILCPLNGFWVPSQWSMIFKKWLYKLS